MRKRTAALLVLLGVGACAGTKLLLDKGPDSGTLRVEIRGIEHTEGKMRVSLFGTPDGFPNDWEKAERAETYDVTDTVMVWTADDVPTGNWAVAVLHDEDANGEMKTDWLGRPSEGWGVTNDAKGSFGPPSFDDSAVEIGPGGTEAVVNLRY